MGKKNTPSDIRELLLPGSTAKLSSSSHIWMIFSIEWTKEPWAHATSVVWWDDWCSWQWLKTTLSLARLPFRVMFELKNRTLSILNNRLIPDLAQRWTISLGGAKIHNPVYPFQTASVALTVKWHRCVCAVPYDQQNPSNIITSLIIYFKLAMFGTQKTTTTLLSRMRSSYGWIFARWVEPLRTLRCVSHGDLW